MAWMSKKRMPSPVHVTKPCALANLDIYMLQKSEMLHGRVRLLKTKIEHLPNDGGGWRRRRCEATGWDFGMRCGWVRAPAEWWLVAGAAHVVI